LISFTVPGGPVPQGRPRFNARTRKPYYDDETKQYRERVKQYASETQEGRETLIGPCAVIVEAIFTPPECWSKCRKEAAIRGGFHLASKDSDNIAKAVLDSMNKIVYEDDKQVAILVAMKRYGETDATRITVIDLSAIDNPRWLMDSIKRVVKSVDLEPRFRL
jgi:Holliday junction resolvase RusA-like endonuclease